MSPRSPSRASAQRRIACHHPPKKYASHGTREIAATRAPVRTPMSVPFARVPTPHQPVPARRGTRDITSLRPGTEASIARRPPPSVDKQLFHGCSTNGGRMLGGYLARYWVVVIMSIIINSSCLCPIAWV